MEVQPKRPTVKGAAETFTGDVWVDMIAYGEPPSRLRVGIVRFSPGAHTAWHRHVNGQTLHVIDGRGLVQCRDGQVLQVGPGDTIYTPPGEWHWHGASPDHLMSTWPCGRRGPRVPRANGASTSPTRSTPAGGSRRPTGRCYR